MTTYTETMWAIASRRNDNIRLRKGTWQMFENEAKYRHCLAIYGRRSVGEDEWRKCEKQGDRAVKVTMTYEYPDAKD